MKMRLDLWTPKIGDLSPDFPFEWFNPHDFQFELNTKILILMLKNYG